LSRPGFFAAAPADKSQATGQSVGVSISPAKCQQNFTRAAPRDNRATKHFLCEIINTESSTALPSLLEQSLLIIAALATRSADNYFPLSACAPPQILATFVLK
jgi:hypothetical protein